VPRKSHAVDAFWRRWRCSVVRDLKEKPGERRGAFASDCTAGLVAGVVGIRKFAFDIWGNTVNFAARWSRAAWPAG